MGTVDRVRNLALIAHGGAGKTSLAEAMMFVAGAIDRLGRVDDGSTVCDFEPEEVRRQITLTTGLSHFDWQGRRYNLLDTPGFFDFAGEVKAALRVVEGALIVVDAVSGVEVGTELVSRYAEEAQVPRLAVINKLDRENASFDKALASLQEQFGPRVVPITLPIGEEANFAGVIDVLGQKAYLGPDALPAPVPAEFASQVAGLRERLVEIAAETDDELVMKYLEGEPLSETELQTGIQAAVRARAFVPAFAASGTKLVGVKAMLNLLAHLTPAPVVAGSNPSALVFKTMADPFVGKISVFRVYGGSLKSDSMVSNISQGQDERLGQLFLIKGKQHLPVREVGPGEIAGVAKLAVTATNDTLGSGEPLAPIEFPQPVYGVAVYPKSKGDEEKIGSGLARLVDEDPSLKVLREPVTGEVILSGLGDMHLDVAMERLKRKFGADGTLTTPKMAYKETIRGKAKAEYRHKKQSGGRGQYGHVIIEIEPLPGAEYEFVDKIFAGSVPLQYRPAVDKGVRETMAEGVLAGYPVTGVRCTLLDGSYHDVDSSEMAFKLAASQAFKKAFSEARPTLLEPIMAIEVTVPDQYMGDIMGDLNKKRGRIMGMEPVGGGSQVVKALVPQVEAFKYAIDLRSMTQGRGSFAMQFDHYEEMPANVAQAVIDAAGQPLEA